MTTAVLLLIAFVKGLFLGGLFFFILWLSARKLIDGSWAPTWFVVSWLIRMLLAIAGFYWISGGDSLLLIAGLCGFIVARIAVGKWVNALPSLVKPKLTYRQ